MAVARMARNEPSKGATAERNPNADKDAWDAEKRVPNATGDDGREIARGGCGSFERKPEKGKPRRIPPPKKNGSFQKNFKGKINGVLLVYTLI